MTYNSSPQTFIFKYIFPVIFLVGGSIVFVVFKTSGNEVAAIIANGFGIALVWISIFLIQMPFRLKRIEVNERGLKLSSGNEQGIIPFRNVISVSKFDLSSPVMITVRYLDPIKNENRKISYMPASKHQRFMKEDEMTEYLTMQSKLNNSNFEEPITLRNLIILFLAGLPFSIGMIYYMFKAMTTYY